ncbi:hypothetical protein [Nocardioides alpinus]|uniref:hypothetical protein n=1 Tax=Nocardioides alpinus TaxID=748909 RepID=UPI000B843033|nr:hypothetical protein [Nocardioides alpinus]
MIAAATAAPAFAASPCATTYGYTLNWGNATAEFNRASTTAASASATSTSVGAQKLSIGFASALITSGNNNSVNGHVLDVTHNLTVPGPAAGGGGGVAPNVTNLGNITPGGAERGLCLQHSTSSTANVSRTGNPDRGQRLTISFPRDVTNLTFWIVDIDSTTSGYWDRVRFTTTPTVVTNSASVNINGTGSGTTPFRYGTTQTNNNFDENTANARVKVSFAGPLTSLTMEYWNAGGTGVQRVFLADFAFDALGC